MGTELTPEQIAAAEAVLKVPKHAVLNFLIEYQCPHCDESLGEADSLILPKPSGEFYEKMPGQKIICGTCKREVFHDPIILRTLSERKP